MLGYASRKKCCCQGDKLFILHRNTGLANNVAVKVSRYGSAGFETEFNVFPDMEIGVQLERGSMTVTESAIYIFGRCASGGGSGKNLWKYDHDGNELLSSRQEHSSSNGVDDCCIVAESGDTDLVYIAGNKWGINFDPPFIRKLNGDTFATIDEDIPATLAQINNMPASAIHPRASLSDEPYIHLAAGGWTRAMDPDDLSIAESYTQSGVIGHLGCLFPNSLGAGGALIRQVRPGNSGGDVGLYRWPSPATFPIPLTPLIDDVSSASPCIKNKLVYAIKDNDVVVADFDDFLITDTQNLDSSFGFSNAAALAECIRVSPTHLYVVGHRFSGVPEWTHYVGKLDFDFNLVWLDTRENRGLLYAAMMAHGGNGIHDPAAHSWD